MNETSNFNSTTSDNLTFTDVITNPYFYGSSFIFIILILCILFFIIILKKKKETSIFNSSLKKAKKNIGIFSYINSWFLDLEDIFATNLFRKLYSQLCRISIYVFVCSLGLL